MKKKPVAAGKSSFDLLDPSKAFSLLNIQEGITFLDLACGVGRYSLQIAERIGQGRVYALDLWTEGIEALRQEIDSRQLRNIRALIADMRQHLPFRSSSIEHCLIATVLHDLPADDQCNVLGEISRVLTPNGDLSIIEFKKIDRGPGPPLTIRLDGRDLEALTAPFGFRLTEHAELGPYVYISKFKNNQ